MRKILLLLALCATAAAGQQDLCDFTAEADAADIDGLELLMGDPADSCEGYSVSFVNFRATVAANLTTTGVLTVPAGTAAAPSLALGASTDGFYRAGAAHIGVSLGGALVFQLEQSLFQSAASAGFRLSSGSATATNPVIMPRNSDTDTGIGSAADNAMTLVAAGVERARVTTTGVTVTDILRIAPQASAPAACTIGDLYVDTSGAYCGCTATNTWTNFTLTGTCT